MKQKAVLLVAVVAAGLLAGVLFKRSQPPMETSATETMAARTERHSTPVPAIVPDLHAPENQMTKKSAGDASVKTNGAFQPPAQKNAKPKNDKPPLQDPMARAALSLVGADSGAEAYWITAIFDPGLPVKEREDLMEDLNEDGLSDPKHPGPQDLPLILNRLAIIEEVAPYADPFMQQHLLEAYKDLNNLLAGKPGQ